MVVLRAEREEGWPILVYVTPPTLNCLAHATRLEMGKQSLLGKVWLCVCVCGGGWLRCESLGTWQKVEHSSFTFHFLTPDSCWKASPTTGKINCYISWVVHKWSLRSSFILTDYQSSRLSELIFSIFRTPVIGIGVVLGVIADLINWSPSCDETTAATMAATFSSSNSWLRSCDYYYYMTSQKWLHLARLWGDHVDNICRHCWYPI